MTGAEDYVESVGSGLVAGISTGRLTGRPDLVAFPVETILGSMANYTTTTSSKHSRSMNASFNLIPPSGGKIHNKRGHRQMASGHGLEKLARSAEEVKINN